MGAAEKITAPEDLASLEQVVFDGMRTFVEVGQALAKIKDGKKYQEKGFKTFEAYCRDVFDMSRTRSYELINAARVLKNLSEIPDIPAPSNAEQTRPLARLKESETQAEAWKQAVETAPEGKVTAKQTCLR